MRRFALGALLATAVAMLALWAYWAHPFWGFPFRSSASLRPPTTPAWALECWLWEDDANTADRVRELLEGYRAHDVPVRTILIDSPWSTRYNDFTFDATRYPEPDRFLSELQDQGYRVVLWMTCMVNSANDDTAVADSADWFAEAAANGYLAGGDYQWNWWKGRGGFIDYTHPDAMAWWRSMQRPLFETGLDGWKLDGTATFFSSRLGPLPVAYQRVHNGWMTTRTYMDHYYRDEYTHGVSRNPEFVTLSRSLDRYGHPEGFAPIDAAPVTWVGDQDHAWTLEDEGLEEAIVDVLRSAQAGYSVIGSDVGGFSGAVIPPRLYIRWAQFSAFCPLFMNGGHGERALWRRSPLELKTIRMYSWLHTELAPYVYAHAVACAQGGSPVIRPMGFGYQYAYGDAFLVAPVYRDTLTREVRFPEGRWHYLFDERVVVEGPTTTTREYPLTEYPVYVREGSVVPMQVSRPYTGFGDSDSADALTLALYPGDTGSGPRARERAFALPEASRPLRVTMKSGAVDDVLVADADDRPLVLRVVLSRRPARVEREGTVIPEADAGWNTWRYDAERGILWVRSDQPNGRFVIASGGAPP